MIDLQNINLKVKINAKHHAITKKFAIQQDTVEKGKQVYLNTLAVLVVNDFLKWMNVNTDLESGESWNPVTRCFFDVADLVIPNLGKIECRRVIATENKTVFELPSEVQEDRIAYIFVKFVEELQECELMGFYPVINSLEPITTISEDQLEPIEEITDYLFKLEIAHDFLASDDEVAIRFRKRFDPESLQKIVIQLEKNYHNISKESERKRKMGVFLKQLAGGEETEDEKTEILVLSRTKNSSNNSSQSKGEDWVSLAEELLEKFAEIWTEN